MNSTTDSKISSSAMNSAPDGMILSEMKEYYKNSENYCSHLQAKGPVYFERFLSVVCDCSSPSDLILDVGCGTGESTNEIRKHGRRVIGTDLSQLFMRQGNNREPGSLFVTADASRLPFPDHSFDLVCAMEFIEHVWPVEDVLSEMDRVLKPSGQMIIFSPNLLSPLWPLRDLPGMILKRQFRPPFYRSFSEALKFFRSSVQATLWKVSLNSPEFLFRQPDMTRADNGGDHDSVYCSHSRDIMLFLEQRGYDVCFAVGTHASLKSRLRMLTANIFGSLWTSFIVKGTKLEPGTLVSGCEK